MAKWSSITPKLAFGGLRATTVMNRTLRSICEINLVSGDELYRWSFASANGKTATSSSGAVILVHHQFGDLPRCDRLFVMSGINMDRQDTRSLLAALRRERSRGTQIGAHARAHMSSQRPVFSMGCRQQFIGNITTASWKNFPM